jgi:hypothetical protein
LLSGAAAERKNYTIRPDVIHKGGDTHSKPPSTVQACEAPTCSTCHRKTYPPHSGSQ